MKWPRKHQHQPETGKKKKKTKNSNKKPSYVPFFSRILPFFCLSHLSVKPTPRPPSDPKRSSKPGPTISGSSLRSPPAPPPTASSACSPPSSRLPLATPTMTPPSSDPDSPRRTRWANSISDRTLTEDWVSGSPSRPRIADSSRRPSGVRIRDPRPPLPAGNRSRPPGSAPGGRYDRRFGRGERSPSRSGQEFYQQRRGRRRTGEEGEERESFAATKYSGDPQEDFRESMAEMIVEEGIGRPEEIEKLLACYLCLNSDEHHDAIVKAFRSVWSELNRDQSGSESAIG